MRKRNAMERPWKKMEEKLGACLEKTWEDEKEGERKRERGGKGDARESR